MRIRVTTDKLDVFVMPYDPSPTVVFGQLAAIMANDYPDARVTSMNLDFTD